MSRFERDGCSAVENLSAGPGRESSRREVADGPLAFGVARHTVPRKTARCAVLHCSDLALAAKLELGNEGEQLLQCKVTLGKSDPR